MSASQSAGSEPVVVEPPLYERLLNLGGFIIAHVGAVLALFVHVSKRDVIIVLALFWLRMFAVTGGYHRYFAHKTYKTSRAFQFILAFIGTTATQKGPLWWAAIHRRHHRFSDRAGDAHSPVQEGFYQSHMGWIVDCKHDDYEPSEVKDFASFPELQFVSRYHFIGVAVIIGTCVALGGWQGILWWYCVSTVMVWHAVFTINSLSHVWGKRRYATKDDSRNNWVLALLTMGEGWHNNHHRYMQSCRQGFYWWEVDVTYYILRALSFVGIVWDLHAPPERVLEEGRRPNPAPFVKYEPSAAKTADPVAAE